MRVWIASRVSEAGSESFEAFTAKDLAKLIKGTVDGVRGAYCNSKQTLGGEYWWSIARA